MKKTAEVAMRKKIIAILNPTQLTKLKEVYCQRLLVNGNRLISVLNLEFVKNELEITPEQSRRISTKDQSLQKEFEADLEKLKLKYRKRLQEKELNTEQLKLLKELMGKPIGKPEKQGF